MLRKTLDYASHHAIAILALICSLLALAGASYAATQLPRNSVGNPQIKRGAVGPPKFSKAIGGYVRAYAKISAAGKLQASSPGAKLIGWHLSTVGPSGGTIEWKIRTASKCIALSTAQENFTNRVPTNATVTSPSHGAPKTDVSIQMSGPAGVSVAVIC
jgi:hypothetical protein